MVYNNSLVCQILTELIQEKDLPDIQILPISISADRIFEVDKLANEQHF